MARVGEAQAEAALSFELEANKQSQTIIAEELNVDLSKLSLFFIFLTHHNFLLR